MAAPPEPTNVRTVPVAPTQVSEDAWNTTESGLRYVDLVVGDGASPEVGNTVVVEYAGWLADGTPSTAPTSVPTPFASTLAKDVIKGWDEGGPAWPSAVSVS